MSTAKTDGTTGTHEIPLAARIRGAKAWTPAKDRILDEHIKGHLVTVQRRQNNQGEDYPVLILDLGHGGALVAVHCQSLIAQEELRKLRPAPGEHIGVVAHAPTESKQRKDPNGNPVRYTVWTFYNADKADDVTPEFDWDELPAADDQPGY